MNTPDFSYMRGVAESTFFDECRLGTLPAPEYGTLDVSNRDHVYTDAQPCGFEPGGRRETEDGAQTPDYTATLRLPVGTDVAGTSRVELTARHGTAISPTQIYSVEGPPAIGPSAIVLSLKLVTGESIK